MNDRKTRGHKDDARTTRRWRCILTLLFRIQNERPRAEPKGINYKNIINILQRKYKTPLPCCFQDIHCDKSFEIGIRDSLAAAIVG